MKDLEPRLMRAFLAIYEARSVSAAARAEGVSQPTMSEHLRRLRDYFSDRLFVRGAHGLVVTPRAVDIEPAIRRIVAALIELSNGSSPWLPSTSTRTFRIGTNSYGQSVVLPHLDSRLRAAAPGLVLEIVASGANDVDLEVVPIESALAAHRQQLLFTDELICAFDPNMASHLDLDTFCRFEHVVMAPRPLQDRAGQTLARLGRSRRVAMIVSDLAGLTPLLALQQRLAIIPARLAPLLSGWLVARRAPIELGCLQMVMTWPQQLHGDAGHRWFRSQLAASMKSAGDEPSPCAEPVLDLLC